MAVFRYKGIRSNGKTIQGVVDAASEREARKQLRTKEIYPTELSEESRGKNRSPGKAVSLFSRQKGRSSIQERIVFTRQMSTLLAAGFSVVDSLQVVETQVKAGPMRVVITQLRSAVTEGESLSLAMDQFPLLFPAYYSNLVRAGESGGALDVVFDRLAEVMESQARMRSRLVSAMIYPSIMAVTGIGILVFLMMVVVPGVVQVFQDTHQALPFVTRSLLAISAFLENWGAISLLTILLLSLAFSKWSRSNQGRPRFEQLLFSMPILGRLLRRVITLRVTQTLALLLRSGVQIMNALQITADATGYVTLKKDLQAVARSVGQGVALAESLEKTKRFPPLALRLIQAGETSGNLEEMLERAADIYEDEIRRMTERMMNMVEPIIVLLMGAVVAYVVIAVMLPIFEMNTFIR